MTREALAAIAYAERGWAVFPVADKKPLTAHGFRDASCDVERVRDWWRSSPSVGIGWALPRGLFVLDVDPRHGGRDSLARLQQQHGELPLTLSQQTGGGGLHMIYQAPEGADVRQTASELAEGVDTRAGGKGYIVLAPSLHTSGQRYRWLARVPIADAPRWLLALLGPPRSAARPDGPAPLVRTASRYAAAALAGEANAVASTSEGGRNARLFKAWLRLTRDPDVAPHLPRDQVRATLTRSALIAGLPEDEIRRTLRDVKEVRLHPDRGGSHDQAAQVNGAVAEARMEFGT